MSQVVRPHKNILCTDLQGEMVLLQLDTEQYFTLDAVGSRMWEILTKAESIETACEELLKEYDIDESTLRNDVEALIQQLLETKLIEVNDA